MGNTRRGGGWPDDDQHLLLHAILDEPGAARLAWDAWAARHDAIDGLPDATRRLLPQLARRLDSLGATGELAASVQNRVPHTWTRSRMLLRAIRPALRAVVDAGIEPMAIKGAALAAATEGGFTIRPMFDVDLLVRPAAAAPAARALTAAGFRDVSPRGIDAMRRVAHAAGFRAEDGSEIDLHWRPLPQPGDCETVWRAAVPSSLAGVPLLVPAAEDMLVHACVHGLSAGSSGPRWVADAVLARSAGEPRFDWNRVVATARCHGVGLVVRDALTFVRDEGFLAVPDATIAALARLPAGPHARITHTLVMRPARLGRMVHHVEQWDFHRRSATLAGARPSVWAYLAQEAERMGVRGRLGLVRHWAKRLRKIAVARS